MTAKMHTGILLLNWNNEKNILTHINKISLWKTPPFIIIVDNASKIDISSILDNNYSDVKVIRSPVNRGFSGGNNLGFHYFLKEKFEYILLLNHDADISEDIVTTLLKVMSKDINIGAIGPCTREGAKWYAGGRNIAHYPKTRIPYDPSGPLVREVDYIPGAACILRVSALEKAGIFDERYFFSGEMADLCERIRNSGYLCFVHTGTGITHDIGEDTPMRERIHLYYSIRNRFLFIKKNEKKISSGRFIGLFLHFSLLLEPLSN